jgi:hypothetical protein
MGRARFRPDQIGRASCRPICASPNAQLDLGREIHETKTLIHTRSCYGISVRPGAARPTVPILPHGVRD